MTISTSLESISSSSTAEATQDVRDDNRAAITVYEPVKGWQLLNVRELWRFRELLFHFTWRDVTVRYKQTALGAAWAILQPFAMMVVFSIFLGRMAGIDSGEIPYPIFTYAGLVLWSFFASSITAAGNSVVSASSIVTKVYFPRLIIPFASVGAAAVDFAIASTMLLAMMIYYGTPFHWSLLLIPIPFTLALLSAVGVGTMLAALNVSFRDFRYTMPFLVQLWLFATPTVYMQWSEATEPDPPAQVAVVKVEEATPAAPKDTEAAWLRPLLLYGNPMTSVIGFFRAAVLGTPLPWKQLLASSGVILLILTAGIAYFRRVERQFADII